MQCIYCNSETDLTVSDIIPWALTGAKIQKRFVCHEHNSFTNDNYEKAMIQQFAFFRNLIGLTERDGDPVRFTADLTIDGYTFKRTSISDKSSILGNKKRKFSTIREDGKKIIVGDIDDLLKINGATESQIKTVNLAEISISACSDLRNLFISSQVLHSIAKIAYEWHCLENGVESYVDSKYGGIVSYILTPDCITSPVEIVIDGLTWHLADRLSRTGTNMIFEYQDVDGYTYVIFSFWNVIIYKIRICNNTNTTKAHNYINTYLFHSDGTKESSCFSIVGNAHIIAVSPEEGLSRLAREVKIRLGKLGERDLSRKYLKNNIEIIKKILPKYNDGKCSLAELLDYESNDRFTTFLILDLLSSYRSEYDLTESFTQNMIRILNTDDRFIISEERKRQYLQKYFNMDKSGRLSGMLEEAISFFETLA